MLNVNHLCGGIHEAVSAWFIFVLASSALCPTDVLSNEPIFLAGAESIANDGVTLFERQGSCPTGVAIEVRLETAYIEHVSLPPLMEHFCRLSPADSLCSRIGSSFEQLKYEHVSSQLGDWYLAIYWNSVRVDNFGSLPVLGFTKVMSSNGRFSSGQLVSAESLECSDSFLSLDHWAGLTVSEKRSLARSQFRRPTCPGSTPRLVALVKDLKLIPALEACILENGSAQHGLRQFRAHWFERPIRSITPANPDFAYAWTFHPHSDRWLRYDDVELRQSDGKYFAVWSNIVGIEGPLDVYPVSIDVARVRAAVAPNPMMESDRTMFSAFVHLQQFSKLARAAFVRCVEDGTCYQFPASTTRVAMLGDRTRPKACFQKDETCRGGRGVLLGQGCDPSDVGRRCTLNGRWHHNDSTTLIHELGHLLVNELRSSSLVPADFPSRARTLQRVEDAADAIAMAYTLDPCIGRWVTRGECHRTIDETAAITNQELDSNGVHDNGRVLAWLLELSRRELVADCGEVCGNIKHWVRLIRALHLAEISWSAVSSNEDKVLASMMGVTSAYVAQFTDGETLVRDAITCAWSRSGYCEHERCVC